MRKIVLIATLAILPGVCLASSPMPVCGCVELSDCQIPIIQEPLPGGEEYYGFVGDIQVVILDFSVYVEPPPWSMPGVGWQCEAFPGGAPVEIMGSIYGVGHALSVAFYGLNCCGSPIGDPITPLFDDDGVALAWNEDSDLYVGNVGDYLKIAANIHATKDGQIMAHVWEFYDYSGPGQTYSMVIHYMGISPPGKVTQPWILEVE